MAANIQGRERMKKVLIVLGCLFLVSCGDYHLSNMVFNHYCSDEDFAGTFVYEQVELSDDYILVPPESVKSRRSIRTSLLIEDRKYLIDEQLLKVKYDWSIRKRKKFLFIGPIYKTESIVIRKHDKKVLGKAVTLTNYKGWLHELSIFMENTGNTCPSIVSEHGRNLSYDHHYNLLKRVFYRKK